MAPSSNAERGEGGRILLTIARRLGMVIVLIIAFVLSAVITIYIIFRTGATRVPSVVGKTQTEAQSMAQKAGLRVKVQIRPDAKVPKNLVIETRPIPDSAVKKDSTLVIVVSSGPSTQTSRVDTMRLPMERYLGSPSSATINTIKVPLQYLYPGAATARCLQLPIGREHPARLTPLLPEEPTGRPSELSAGSL